MVFSPVSGDGAEGGETNYCCFLFKQFFSHVSRSVTMVRPAESRKLEKSASQELQL